MHDSEFFHPSKLSQLPYQIREHARAVARGSLPALARVHAFRKSLSVPQQLLLAPMYYSILDLSHLASISTLDWDSDAETVHQRLSAVLSSMDSMVNLIEFHIPDRAMDEIWVRIWAWMQFVDDFREQLAVPLLRFQSAVAWPGMNSSDPSDLSPHQHLFPQILLAYLIQHRRAASNFLQSNPRIFAIVGRAWNALLSQEAVDDGQRNFRSNVGNGIYAASFSLLYHGRELLRRDGPHIEQLIDGVGGAWGHLASLLTRHLTQSINISGPGGSPEIESNLERVYAILHFLPGVPDEDSDPRLELRAALVEVGLVAVLTGLSLRLVKTPHVGKEIYTGTPELAFHALMRLVIFDARSELRVVEALRAGLLRTLVEYASTGHHLRGLMLDDARYLLATVIGEHCVYLSVLRALPVAFAEIAELNPAQHFDRVGLGEEWADCEQFVRERLAVVDVYSTGTLSCWRACDNTECGFLGDKRGLKRCAGCQDAWFCSRECQKVDWDNGHRKNCKILRDSLIEYSSNLKPRDRAFHRALLNFDHAAHEEEHIALLVPLMNRTAPLTSTMDYSGGRMQTKISPAGATHDGSFQVLKQRAQRAGDRTQLSWMYYMQGSTVRMRGVLRRFAEPDLYEGLREYAATREGLEEPEKIIMDSRRIPELAVLAGKCTY